MVKINTVKSFYRWILTFIHLDIGDVEIYMPGLLEGTNLFFETYKIPSGKSRNAMAFAGEAKDKKFATNIILETHEHWKLLVNGTIQNSEIQT